MGTVSIIFREDKVNRKGLAPIAIKIYDSLTGKRKQTFTGIRVAPEHWNSSSLRVSKSHPNSTRYNKAIASKFNEAYQTLLEVEQKGKTEEPFAREEDGDIGGDLDFFAYGQTVLKEFQGVEAVYSRFERVQGALSRLKRYLQFLKTKKLDESETSGKEKVNWKNREFFTFSDFTFTFIDGFGKYVRSELGLKPASMKASMTGIRTIFDHATKHNKVDKKWMGFGEYKVERSDSKIDFLRLRHLQELEAMKLLPGSVDDVIRDMYMLCSYGGGFRWGDVARMKWSKIEGNEIYFKTGKSKSDVAFMIPDIALKILAKYKTREAKPSDFIFPILNTEIMKGSLKQQRYHVNAKNKLANKSLKSFREYLGIDWDMTFHSSRHTFATMAISNGMPVEVLRDLLGHSNIAKTMVYVHITGERIRAEMAKFNQRLNGLSKMEGSAGEPTQKSGATVRPMADFVRRFIESTAVEIGVEVIGIDGLALEMYEAIQQLPKESQRTVPVRVEVRGDFSSFEQMLTARSLFGEVVRFVVEERKPFD